MSSDQPTDGADLSGVRLQIDEIDDALHDLLMQRTLLVGRVRDAKRATGDDAVAYRPGREAQILRRLIDRHEGEFPKPVLVRIWREIMTAILRLQGPFTVAVYAPEGLYWYWDHARDHFGAATPMTGHQSARAVITAVSEGNAAVGVLPLPEQDQDLPWWITLGDISNERPSIVGRIPFAPGGSGRNEGSGALVIGKVPFERTGHDRTLLLIRSSSEVSRASITSSLRDVGFSPESMIAWSDAAGAEETYFLVDVPDYAEPDDARFGGLADPESNSIREITVLGGYAAPFAVETLDSGPARK